MDRLEGRHVPLGCGPCQAPGQVTGCRPSLPDGVSALPPCFPPAEGCRSVGAWRGGEPDRPVPTHSRGSGGAQWHGDKHTHNQPRNYRNYGAWFVLLSKTPVTVARPPLPEACSTVTQCEKTFIMTVNRELINRVLPSQRNSDGDLLRGGRSFANQPEQYASRPNLAAA